MRAAHQARIRPCGALPVGIGTARNRPVTTKCCHTSSRRVRLHMPSGPLGSPKMAHAPGRGMAPFCRHRTIPGCPDAYRRFTARYNPRLMRGGPPRRTEACARRPPRTGGSLDPGARFASQHYKNEAFLLYPHTSHLSHHSDVPLCRQHKVWLRLRSPTQHARAPHRHPLSSPPRRMARPTDLRVRRPQTVLATSLGHSTP